MKIGRHRSNMDRKLVLITGVTRGIGHAMVKEFVRGTYRPRWRRTRQRIEQLRKEHPDPHDFYMVDVASDEEVNPGSASW